MWLEMENDMMKDERVQRRSEKRRKNKTRRGTEADVRKRKIKG